ncbi:hypothetical protein Poli38472_005126 [Pythium oligandrum]|uniref:Flavodoxin-like domain-containing protein n=1 Tax=Pythium oligandrum TaxID=41045 RepID=A0A8K1CGD3_PYTOL|nr:hypothetical protein Poli38472_005126 [Pythium oligandrum]|eukprot:TMW62508.1 hypothetical protein Poli38472_005126 [Pythium oligandrum]
MSRLLSYQGVDPAWEERERSAFAKHSNRPGATVGQFLLGRFLEEDIHVSCKPMLPRDVVELNGKVLKGVCILQIVDVVNIGASFEHRTENSKGPSRTLKLCLTDGYQVISGFEYQWLPQLSVNTPRGSKVAIQNVAVRHGMLLLTPSTCQLVGSSGEPVEADKRKTKGATKDPTAGAYSAALLTTGSIGGPAIKPSGGTPQKASMDRDRPLFIATSGEQSPIIPLLPVNEDCAGPDSPKTSLQPQLTLQSTSKPPSIMTKVAIIYYSTYGHIVQMAEAVKEGVEKVEGVTATIYQVPETLPEDILTLIHAPAKKDYPIATPDTLKEYDGILFGFPTRFGSQPSQIKAFFDGCGGLWAAGALVGKPAGIFFSTGSLGSGQETTAYSALPFFAHQGMTYVPLGYRSPLLFNLEEVHGGSPWGAGTIAGGDGSRQPSQLELDVAKVQGESFAQVAKKLAA